MNWVPVSTSDAFRARDLRDDGGDPAASMVEDPLAVGDGEGDAFLDSLRGELGLSVSVVVFLL